MSDVNADSAGEQGLADGGKSSRSRFTEIFLAELGRLKRIVAGMGFAGPDGEDILQDVSVQALRRAGEYRTADEAVRWLMKVTVNRCVTEHRRRQRFFRKAPEILKRLPEAERCSRGPDEKVIEAEEVEIVRETLLKLDGSLLAAMVLRYFCDLNSKEAGEVLGLNPSTVRSRLREGRMILAKRLAQRGIEP